MPAPDHALVEAMGEAAAEAGCLALRRLGEGVTRWEKAPGHPVCDADLEVDVLLRERLRAIDPDAAWLSEETADDPARLAARRLWVVDPIDGTRDYLRGRPGWCVSVALAEEGALVAGVLDAPALGQRWRAVCGAGAFRNGARLHASVRQRLAGVRVPADTLPRTDEDLVPVPRANSIALRLCMVAADEADLCASLRWGNEWDVAAAALIAAEAGATVSDALGAPLRFNQPEGRLLGILASAPAIHGEAVARLADRARAAAASPPR